MVISQSSTMPNKLYNISEASFNYSFIMLMFCLVEVISSIWSLTGYNTVLQSLGHKAAKL